MKKITLIILLTASRLYAQSSPTVTNFAYDGAYQMPSPLNNANCIAYNPTRASWYEIDNRISLFHIREFHVPDDAAYVSDGKNSCVNGANNPNYDQTKACNATMLGTNAKDWGTHLANVGNIAVPINAVAVGNPTTVTVNNHGFSNGQSVFFYRVNSTPPLTGPYTISNVTTNTFTVPINVTVTNPGTSGFGGYVQSVNWATSGFQGILVPDPDNGTLFGSDGNELFGCYWDDTLQRLFLSTGDFYGCTNNRVLTSIDFSTDPFTVRGQWILYDQEAGRQLNCGEAETKFMRGTASILNSDDANITARRGCPGNHVNCNNASPRPLKTFFATGMKQSGTGGNAPWSPDLYLCDQPLDSDPFETQLNCVANIYWKIPGPNNGGYTIIDDLGQSHASISQVASLYLRRDTYQVILGTNATGSLPGTPLDCSNPYGLYTVGNSSDVQNGLSHTGMGWAPGIGNSGDVAHELMIIDEADFSGFIYTGHYAVGPSFYGIGTWGSEDFTNDATKYTTVKSCDGIYSSHYGVSFFPVTAIGSGSTPQITATGHTFVNGDKVWFALTNSTPVLQGPYTVSGVSGNNFNISGVTTTVTGNTGFVQLTHHNGSLVTLGRWLTDQYYAPNGTGCNQDGINGSGFNSRTGTNPCGYIYNRRNGGKGYNNSNSVPAMWIFSMASVQQAVGQTFTPRGGLGLTSVNVDHTGFMVLGANATLSHCDSGTTAVLDLNPAYCNYQFNNLEDNYNVKTPRNFDTNGSYFRPTGTSSGTVRQLYILNDSAQGSSKQLINRLHLVASCGSSAPTAPSGVTIDSNKATSTTLNVAWTDNSSNEDSFTLQRYIGSTPDGSPKSLAANSISYDDSGLTPSTTYTYKIYASNCGGSSTVASGSGSTKAATGPPIVGKFFRLFKR